MPLITPSLPSPLSLSLFPSPPLPLSPSFSSSFSPSPSVPLSLPFLPLPSFSPPLPSESPPSLSRCLVRKLTTAGDAFNDRRSNLNYLSVSYSRTTRRRFLSLTIELAEYGCPEPELRYAIQKLRTNLEYLGNRPWINFMYENPGHNRVSKR